jgi:ketosteroid isomerase-like protein
MVSATTLKKLEAAYQTWNEQKGSTAEPWFDLMADKVEWKSIAGGEEDMRFTRPHSSKQQVREYFSELAKDWQMEFYHVRTFLVQRDTVAVVGECCWRHKGTDKIVHSPKLDIMRFENEKLVGFFEFFDTEQAFHAASANSIASETTVPEPLYPEKSAMIFQGITDVSKSNVDRLKSLYTNWNETKGQSVNEIMDVLAPQVSWGSLARGADAIAFTSQKMSQQDVTTYFKGLSDAFQMKFYRADEFLVAADYVLVLGSCSFTNKATGETFKTRKADLWRFSDDKAVEFFEYYDTAAVVATTR